ncbi:hypothetical protein PM082_004183 [Marasmius tenuissimus]|nr:hypothetical protein PM082_004183 [Marasmius tenuissimus]
MEKKGDSVTRPMLIEKRKRFKMLFNVPDDKKLKGTGWLISFKAAYQLWERRRHGEDGSVDIRRVGAKRERMWKWFSRYALEDRFNVDETSFFPSALPDRSRR